MVSRVLGFMRDILIAAFVGAGVIGDAFFVAFKIPNLFRRLFAEGAFSAGFIPIFTGLLQKNGPGTAQKFAQEAFSFLFVTLGIIVAIFEIFMPWLMIILAPGFSSDPEKFDLAVTLTRITFPYLLFVSLVSLHAGVLNSIGKFATGAATPILLNVCLIGALLWFRDFLPTAGHSLAWGVAAAGVAQLAWIAFASARAGYRFRFQIPRFGKNVRTLINRMLPAAVGSGVAQINIVVDIMIASFLPVGSISYLFFADRLTQLPLGVIGVATGTVLLPILSREVSQDKIDSALYSFNRAVEVALLIAIPSAVALIVTATPVVRVLFERGAFDLETTQLTAKAVWAYAMGIPAYVLIKVLSPGFFARGDTKTPVRIAILALSTNIILNLLLMGPMLHAGLALATAISAWLNAGLLLIFLTHRGYFVPDKRLVNMLPRSLFSATIMMLGVLFLLNLFDSLLSGTTPERILSLLVVVFVGVIIYSTMAHLTGIIKLGSLVKLMKGREH